MDERPQIKLPEEQEEQQDVKTLLSWHAPGRPFRMRGREYLINITIISTALAVLSFLVLKDYLLILVIVTVAFIAYALRTVPPHEFYYKISSEGLMIEDHFLLWEELYDFYIKRIENEVVIMVRTKTYFPGELLLTLGHMDSDHVKRVLLNFLPYREYVKPTLTEQWGDWLGRTFPLDKLPSKEA